MKSLDPKRRSDLDLPHRRRSPDARVRWWDLWLRIRFTRAQLFVFLGFLVFLGGCVYLGVNFSSIQELWQRRKAVELIQNCRELLTQLEDMPNTRVDLLRGANSQLEQAENALQAEHYARAISFAQQGIDLLEEELRWMRILETGRAAKLERIEGDVQVRRPGSDLWENADPAIEIEEESEIRTGKNGQAKIRFDNGASSEITPDSLLIVRRLGVDTLNRTFENDVRLEQGEMEYRSQRRADASQLDVPNGSFRSKGAVHVRAAYRQEQERPTSIDVLEGQGQFSDLKGNLVSLDPMTRVHVASDGSVLRPRDILLAPEPIAPPTASSLRFSSGEAIEVLFRWSHVQGASGYQLEISESSRFEKLLEKSTPKTNEVKIGQLDEGIYWWRIRSLDADGTPSEPSLYRSFRIQVSNEGAKAAAAGPKVDFSRVKFISRVSVLVEGQTDFGVQLLVNDQPISVDLNGHFRDILVVRDPNRPLHVEAVDPDGNQSSFPVEVQP